MSHSHNSNTTQQQELQEKYNPETDPYANRELNINYGAKFMENQVLSKEPTYLDKLRQRTWDNSACRQLQQGLGTSSPFFWGSLLFGTYLGGLYVARKQHITGNLYFLNHHFDFIAGKKAIVMGTVFGVIMGSSLFGKPYLVEDYLGRVARSWRRMDVEDKDKKEFIICEIPTWSQIGGNASIFDK